MVKSIVLGGSALALSLMASSAFAGDMSGVPGSYGGGGGPVGYGPGTPTAEDYPPNALPGQCFAKVLVPEVTETFTEQVLVSPEKIITRVVPGECRYEDKTVVVREPSFEFITVPATFRTVTETVVVKPGGSHTETIPPEYDTVTEQVLIREGYTVWRPGSTVAGYTGANGATYGGSPTYAPPPPSAYAGTGALPNPAYGGYPTKVLPTGEVLCLVAVPPEYKTITKQVLRVPGRTVEVPYPPETQIITRQVVDIPAHTERREIPGETKIVKVKVCLPDQTQTQTIPPEYKTITKIKTISPSKFEWKTVDCKTEVVHGGYTPPPVYGPPPPHVTTYDAPPPRIGYGEEHPIYHKRVHVYHAPVAAYTPPVRTYAPPPVYMAPPHHGKVCHSTCTDDPAPVGGYAPPVTTGYSQTTTTYSSGHGDRAVSNLQGALSSKGYYHGPQNGMFTQDTMSAMVAYQHANHLTEGRYNGETANSLGITR